MTSHNVTRARERVKLVISVAVFMYRNKIVV